MKKIRLGVIGCGGIVSGAHIVGIKAEKDRMQVTATCDTIIKRAQHAAEVWGATKVTTDWTEIVDDVDAVLIALPHDLHHACGKFFLEHGKDVLMEKPLAVNEWECIDLIETAKRTQRLLMVAYPLRYVPEFQVIKKLLDEKTYGDVFQISLWTEQNTHGPRGGWGNAARGLGGGQFYSHGCHYVDLMLWMLGKPKRGVHIGNRIGTPWMEKEGTSNVIVEFESGVMAYHFGTWGAAGTRLGYSFHFHCTKGMIEYNMFEGKIYAHTNIADHIPGNHGANESCEVIYESDQSGKNTVAEMSYFLDCLLDGKKTLTPPEDSLQGLRVIWKLYEAERDNEIVDLTGLGLEDDWRAVPVTEHGVWEEWENAPVPEEFRYR